MSYKPEPQWRWFDQKYNFSHSVHHSVWYKERGELNINGGAIALGHPLGCPGARILTTRLYEVARRAELGETMRFSLANLCIGVRQGKATLIERIG